MAGESDVALIVQQAVGCTEKEAYAAATEICRTPEVRNKLLKECGINAAKVVTYSSMVVAGADIAAMSALAPEPILTKTIGVGVGISLAKEGLKAGIKVSPKAKRFCKAYYNHSKIYDIAQLPGKFKKKISDTYLEFENFIEDPFKSFTDPIKKEANKF